MDRKSFLGKALRLAVGKSLEVLTDNPVGKKLEDFAEEQKASVPTQRPPGAEKSEREFLQKCTGCDQCMIACPVHVIMVDDLERRDPVIYPEEAPCIHCPDTPCIAACPTGALSLDNGTEVRDLKAS